MFKYATNPFFDISVWVVLLTLFSLQDSLAQPLTLQNNTPQFRSDSGVIYDVLPLDDGGYLVGGSFDFLNETFSPYLARILPDGTVDPDFAIRPSGQVRHLERDSSDRIYVAGFFGQLNGKSRPDLFRLNADLTEDAAYSAAIGTATNSTPTDLILTDSGQVFLTGPFTEFNGIGSQSIVKLNVDGSLDTSFTSPGFNSGGYCQIRTLAIDGSGKLLIGGRINSIGGTPASNLARLNADGSNDASFAPGDGPNRDTIYAIHPLSNGQILIGGDFSQFDGNSVRELARLNDDGSLDPTLDIRFDREIREILARGNGELVVIGEFQGIDSGSGYETQKGIAYLQADGSLSATQPTVAWDEFDQVYTAELLVTDNLILGGRFSTTGTDSRGLLETSSSGTQVSGWKIWDQADVNDLSEWRDGALFVAGEFTHVDGHRMEGLAKFDSTGALDLSFELGWPSKPSSTELTTLAEHQEKLLVGGRFRSWNGSEWTNSVARFDPENGERDDTFQLPVGNSRNPNVKVIHVLSDDGLLIGGSNVTAEFSSSDRLNLIQVRADGSIARSWDSSTGPSSTVEAIAETADGSLVVAGGFSRWGGDSAYDDLVKLDSSLDLIQDFPKGAGPRSSVFSVSAMDDGRLLIGGAFSNYDGDWNQRYLTRLLPDGSVDPDFEAPTFSSFVRVLTRDDSGRVLVGGDFASVEGSPAPGIVRLDPDGTLDDSVFLNTSWVGGGRVRSILARDTRVEVGGNFVGTEASNHTGYAAFLAPEGIPKIASHPQSQNLAFGDDLTLSVSALGDTLSYQWQKNGVDLAGETGTSLTIPSIADTDAGKYRVFVSNAAGTSRSINARVLVDPWPIIQTQPEGDTVEEDQSVQLSVVVAGEEPFSYQWYEGTSGDLSSPIEDETDSTYSPLLSDAGLYSYWVQITNAYGLVNSNTAAVTVNEPEPASPPNIDVGLQSKTVDAGTPVTFSVTASGDGVLSYEWRFNGEALPETGDTLQITSADLINAGSYEVTVSSSQFSDAENAISTAQLNVRTDPEIQVGRTSIELNEGDDATLSATVSGPGPFTFSWQKDGLAIPDANTSSLTLTNIQGEKDVGIYRLQATNSFGTSLSAPIHVVVNSPPSITVLPEPSPQPVGESVTLSVSASGTGILDYTWYQGLSGNESNPVGTGASLDTGALQETTQFWVKVSNLYGEVDSETITVEVGNPPSPTVSPPTLRVNQSETAGFSVSVVGDGTFAYQWKKGGEALDGENSSSLTISNAQEDDGGNYSVEVSSEFGTVESAAVSLQVVIAPRIDTQPEDQTALSGESVSFAVEVSGSAPFTYQWLKNGSPIPSSNSNRLTLSGVDANDVADYLVRVSNDAGSTESLSASLTLNTLPVIQTGPETTNFVATGSSVTLSVAATGTAPLTYQWYEGISGQKDQPVGSNHPEFISPALSASTSFWVEVSNVVGAVESQAASVNVGNSPDITSQPQDVIVDEGSAFTLEVQATGDAPLNYAWSKATVSTPVAVGENTPQYSVMSATSGDEGTYKVTVLNDYGEVESATVSVTVRERVAPRITNDLSDDAVSVGDRFSLRVQVEGSGPVSYQWFKGDNPLPGEASPQIAISSVQLGDAGEYWCRVTNEVGFVDSNRATLTVLQPPVLTVADLVSSATNTTTELSASVAGSVPIEIKWYEGALGDRSNLITTSAFFTTPVLEEDAFYWVEATNDAGRDDAAVSVNVIDPVQIIAQPQPQTVTEGESVSFSVDATGGGTLFYKWALDDEFIAEGLSNTLSITSVDSDDAGQIQVEVSNAVSKKNSQSVDLVVNQPPRVLTAFQDQVVSAGARVVLSVSSAGTQPFRYQWFKNNEVIDGENGSSLIFDAIAVKDAGTYKIRVENDYGSDESSEMILQVDGPPVVGSIRGPSEADFETSVDLMVDATGPGPLTYSWFEGQPPETDRPVGANSATLSTSPLTGDTSFWVRVANAFGSDDSQAKSIAVVLPVPELTSSPAATTSVGDYFSYRITATHNPTEFSVRSLPPGLEFDSESGLIFGVVDTSGASEIGLRATNSSGFSESILALTALPKRAVYTGLENISAKSGEPLEWDLSVQNNVDSITVANLPDWLNYDSSIRRFSGMAGAPGNYEFQVVLTNAGGTTTQTIKLSVGSASGAPQINSVDFAAGRVGESFSHTFTSDTSATGFQLTGDLPAGLNMNSFTGTLTGTPNEAGDFTLEVRAENAVESGPTQVFTLKIAEGIGLPSVTNLVYIPAFVGERFSMVLEATNGPSSFEAENLPIGFQLVENGGIWSITGDPQFFGVTKIRIRALNSRGTGSWREIDLNVKAGRETPVISSEVTAVGRKGEDFEFQLTATENPGSFAADGLPAGLSVSETSGLISGVPQVSGDFTVTVSAENPDGRGPSANVRLSIGPVPGAPVLLTDQVLRGQQTRPLRNEFIAHEGIEEIVRYTALTELPDGIRLGRTNGKLYGTPAEKGRFEFVVQAESSFGFVSEPVNVALEVRGAPGTPNLISERNLEPVLDESFNYTLQADESFDDVRLEGDLPPGLNRDGTQISGTPEQAGHFPVGVTFSNQSGAGLQSTLLFNVLPGDATPRITNLSAIEMAYGEAFSLQVSAVNGPIEAWRINNLPPGIDYDPQTGFIEGRPARVGQFTASLSASNANGFGLPQRVDFIVKALPDTPVVTSPRELVVSQGRDLTYQITATKLDDTLVQSAENRFYASGLPSSLILNSHTGKISGKLDHPKPVRIKVWAENSTGEGNPITVTFRPEQFGAQNPLIFGPSFIALQAGTPKTVTFDVAPGIGNIILGSFFDEEVQLDTFGLTTDEYYDRFWDLFESYAPNENDASVLFRPRKTGQQRFIFGSYAGNNNYFADATLTLIHILPGTDNAVVTSPSEFYTAAGAEIEYPVTYTHPGSGGFVTIEIQDLPTGLYYDGAAEKIRGHLDVPGSYSFRIYARNLLGKSAPKNVRFYVAPSDAAPTIESVNELLEPAFSFNAVKHTRQRASYRLHPSYRKANQQVGITVDGIAGEFLQYRISAGGSVEQYSATGLPEGLILNTVSGHIRGTPERPGNWTAEISAKNASGWGQPTEVHFNIAAAAGTPVISSATNLSAQVNLPFSTTVTASNQPDSFNVTGPPAAFSVNSTTGRISGTFARPGTYVWEVSANNSVGEGFTETLLVTVSAASGSPQLTDPGLIRGQVGETLNLSLEASGSPSSWDIEGMPYGLEFDTATGQISGTPLERGTHRFKVSARNALGISDSAELNFLIEPSESAPVIQTPKTLQATEGKPYSVQLTASNNPNSFNASQLPPGLTLDAATGEVSGTMQNLGDFTMIVSATNRHGDGPAETITVSVDDRIGGEATFEQFAQNLPVGERRPDDDSDGDGLLNIFEHAFNSDGNDSNSVYTPSFEVLPDSEVETFAFTYRRNKAATDLDYVLQKSPNLRAWSEFVPDPADTSVVDVNSFTEEVTIYIDMSEHNEFVRLRITF